MDGRLVRMKLGLVVPVLLLATCLGSRTFAQEQAWHSHDVVQVPEEVEQPIVPGSVPLAESSVGFIDSALPLTNFRLRYEANYNADRNTRAEYLLAFPQPIGRGLPTDEPKLNDQRVTTYFEFAPTAKFSAFVEMGARFLDPLVNPDASGLDDMNLGAKWAFWWTEHRVFALQFKGYIPTGDSNKGIGVGHGALEPGILLMHRITERFRMEKEVRLWIPIDGASGAAGSVLKYGISTGYDVIAERNLRVSPTGELVCWTALGGQTRIITPGSIVTQDAYGDTIWNATLGARVDIGPCGRHQLFAGYSRAITGETWFQNSARLEYRLAF